MACNLVNRVWHNKVKSNSRKENANLLETFYGYVFEALTYYKGSTLAINDTKNPTQTKGCQSKFPPKTKTKTVEQN